MWLRAARAFLGVPQAEIAKQANVSVKSISDLEQMLTTPYESTLKRLSEVYEALGGRIHLRGSGLYRDPLAHQ